MHQRVVVQNFDGAGGMDGILRASSHGPGSGKTQERAHPLAAGSDCIAHRLVQCRGTLAERIEYFAESLFYQLYRTAHFPMRTRRPSME